MAYQALYRKWRPKTFNDVVGQSHVIQTLKNEINSKKTAHAYLFCGTRGTGKTSCAKIFARAINCLNPIDGNPCNECEICRGAMDGTILDITEIDAASNNGVDDIRQIRDEVMYSAVHAKYKIYIIDEVHMLSDGAFNALLKTLEEPPEYVVFILATTEAHALPATITSRCQRFDFKRILASDMVMRLREICAKENIKASPEALELIARLADGALRDALSILDQCVCALPDGIDIDGANEVLGIASDDTLNDAVFAIAEHDSTKALMCIDSVVKSGRDLNNFIDTLIRRFRDIMVCKVSPDNKGELFSYGTDITQTIKKQTVHFDIETVSYILNELCDAQAKGKYSKSMKIIYELSLIKLCNRQLDSSNEAVLQRLARLENMIKSGNYSVAVAPKAGSVMQKEPESTPVISPASIAEPARPACDDAPPWEESDDIVTETLIPPTDDKSSFNIPEPVKEEIKEIRQEIKSQVSEGAEKRPSQFGTWADILKLLKDTSPPLYGALACKKAKIADGYIYFVNDGYIKAIVSCMKAKFDEATACILGEAPKIKYVTQNEFDSVSEQAPPLVEELKKRAESIAMAQKNEQEAKPLAKDDDGFDEEAAPPADDFDEASAPPVDDFNEMDAPPADDFDEMDAPPVDDFDEMDAPPADDFDEDSAPKEKEVDPLESLLALGNKDIHLID